MPHILVTLKLLRGPSNGWAPPTKILGAGPPAPRIDAHGEGLTWFGRDWVEKGLTSHKTQRSYRWRVLRV